MLGEGSYELGAVRLINRQLELLERSNNMSKTRIEQAAHTFIYPETAELLEVVESLSKHQRNGEPWGYGGVWQELCTALGPHVGLDYQGVLNECQKLNAPVAKMLELKGWTTAALMLARELDGTCPPDGGSNLTHLLGETWFEKWLPEDAVVLGVRFKRSDPSHWKVRFGLFSLGLRWLHSPEGDHQWEAHLKVDKGTLVPVTSVQSTSATPGHALGSLDACTDGFICRLFTSSRDLFDRWGKTAEDMAEREEEES